jgi:hypothetical protein
MKILVNEAWMMCNFWEMLPDDESVSEKKAAKEWKDNGSSALTTTQREEEKIT